MSDQQQFARIYSDISDNISSAISDLEEINVDHEQGQQQLQAMRGMLHDIQERYKAELDYLEKHSTWDVFSIAFFGETNAGKSTIIDSLRIIFDEQERHRQIQQNISNLSEFEEELAGRVQVLRNALAERLAEYAEEVTHLTESVRELRTQAVEAARVKQRKSVFIAAIAGIIVGGGLIGIAQAAIGG